MSVDPTPPSDQLAAGSTEAVRGGTKTKFNLWVLVIGLILVIGGFAIIFSQRSGERQALSAETQTRENAAQFDVTPNAAEGDSPTNGNQVRPDVVETPG